MNRDLTPDFNKPNLCRSCTFAVIRKGVQYNEETIHCKALSYEKPEQVLYKITECNRYDDGNSPSLYDMKEIAWLLLPNRKLSGHVGFAPPSEARKFERERHKEELPVPPELDD